MTAGFGYGVLSIAARVLTGFSPLELARDPAAYAVAESRRWPIGLGLPFLEARGFYGILAAATLIGVAVDFTDIDPIKALIGAAVINGVTAVPIMAVMMLLAVKPDVMGELTVSRRLLVLGWIATAVMAAAVVAMFATL